MKCKRAMGVACFMLLGACGISTALGQNSYELMRTKGQKLKDLEDEAQKIFKTKGTGQGSGYKQFQRWAYEQHFHLDTKGYLHTPGYDAQAVQNAQGSMPVATAASGSWTEQGPYNWNRTTGWNPGVGRITSISVSSKDTNTIYITSPTGGVWKTTTGGAGNWTPLTDSYANLMNMFSVAVDPTNEQIVYAGSEFGVVGRSTDGGATWAFTASGIAGTVWKILPHPTQSGTLLVAADGGIYRSTNGGASWNLVQNTAKQDIEFKPDNTNIVYASGNHDIQRSADGGLTWTGIGTTAGITHTGRSLIAVSANDPNRVYIVQANGNEFGRFYKSTDAGLSFITTISGSASTSTNYFGYSTTGNTGGGQAAYDMALTANPKNADEVHIAGIIAFKSINAGNSFVATTAWSYPNLIGYIHPDVHVLEYVGNTVYTGSDGGIYKSIDRGDNWTDLSQGLGIRQFYRIASSASNPAVFAGGAQDNGSSIHNGSGWMDWLGGDGMDCMISPTDANLIIGTSQGGKIYRSTNGGSSYSNLNQPGFGQWVTPLAIESNSNKMYGGWNGVYKSTDNGSSWTRISGASIDTTQALTALALAPGNPAYIYASVDNILYTTTNGGASWNKYTAPVSINAIAVSASNPAKIWIAGNSNTANRVAVSTNGGISFTDMSGNLPAITPRCIAVDSDANESVYLGMNLGVYYLNSTLGTNWTDLSENLPKVPINDIEIQKSGSLVRLASYGRGVWQRPLYSAAAQSTPPTANITSPGTGSNYSANSNIDITASAADADGSVAKVEFFQGTVKLGEDLTAPYNFNWNNVAAGSYTITAKATDNSGATASSAAISITVSAPAPTCPDAYEGNNTVGTAKTISFSSAITANIGSSSDVDWFKLSVGNTNKTNIKITLGNLTNDYDLYLYNANNQLVASATGTGLGTEELDYPSSAKRTSYTLKVVSKNGSYDASTCYSLLAEAMVSTTAKSGAAPEGTQSAPLASGKINLYPNPASSQVNIQFGSEQDGRASLQINEVSGKTVFTKTVTVSAGNNLQTLDTRALQPGIYLLQLHNGTQHIVQKFVVIK